VAQTFLPGMFDPVVSTTRQTSFGFAGAGFDAAGGGPAACAFSVGVDCDADGVTTSAVTGASKAAKTKNRLTNVPFLAGADTPQP
jgi:hypothetical protein